MVSKAWFRNVRRRTPGPVALAATAVLLTAGAGGLAPATAVTDLASVTPVSAAAPATAPAPAPVAKAPDKKSGDKGGGAPKSGSPCSAAAKACVDLAKQQAWLTDGAGHVTYGPVPARGGAKGAKTPKGSFSVIWKDQNHLSKEFNNAPMPYSVFFYPGDAFHGGNPAVASNGCIHLNIGAAQRFFNSLNTGDKVEIK
jgi:lipoprotein-anchoring transpeptidase ErfK/SrfK